MRLKSVNLLLAFMTEQDFSQARLARYAGCSRQFIGQLIKGQKNSMTPRVAMNIAEAFGVPVDVLFVPSVASSTDRNVKGSAA